MKAQCTDSNCLDLIAWRTLFVECVVVILAIVGVWGFYQCVVSTLDFWYAIGLYVAYALVAIIVVFIAFLLFCVFYDCLFFAKESIKERLIEAAKEESKGIKSAWVQNASGQCPGDIVISAQHTSKVMSWNVNARDLDWSFDAKDPIISWLPKKR